MTTWYQIKRSLSRHLRQLRNKFFKNAASNELKTYTKLVAEPWYIDSVNLAADNANHLVVTGWCLSEVGLSSTQLHDRIRINGRKPIKISYPLDRPDLSRFFWQRVDAHKSGFEITVAANEYVDGFIKLTFEDPSLSEVESGSRSWYLPAPETTISIPESERRFRVIGNVDLDGFLRVGATDANRIKHAYEYIAGVRWGEIDRILDWGVGCGRLARHLSPLNPSAFHGCDIDDSNVNWCKSNLPGVFSSCRLEPPLPYPDSYFDLIYGISVFTHLRQNWERKWLAELHRVLKPGGIALVTVHGETAVNFAGLAPAEHASLIKKIDVEGLAVTSSNNQLDGFVEHPEEYVNVFHSKNYIHKEWSRYFEGLTILPGYIFTHDLVVAKKG